MDRLSPVTASFSVAVCNQSNFLTRFKQSVLVRSHRENCSRRGKRIVICGCLLLLLTLGTTPKKSARVQGDASFSLQTPGVSSTRRIHVRSVNSTGIIFSRCNGTRGTPLFALVESQNLSNVPYYVSINAAQIFTFPLSLYLSLSLSLLTTKTSYFISRIDRL